MNTIPYLRTLVLLLLTTSCFGQATFKVSTDYLEIEGLSEVQIVDGKVFSKTPPTKATPTGSITVEPNGSIVLLSYVYNQDTLQFTKFNKESEFKWTWTQPGKFKVKFTVIDLVKGSGGEQEIDVELKGASPKPTPTPTPDAVKLDNLSVLFVFESNDLTGYPEPTKQIINSNELKTWFQQQLPELGGLSRVRWYDKDTKFPQCTTVFCKWMSSPPEIPGMIVGNEQQIVYKGKLLPIEEIKALVLKHKK